MLTKKQKELFIEKRAGICEIPSCLETTNLVVHHMQRRNKDGNDNEDNLMLLCKKHHDLIHFKEQGCREK